MIQQTDKAWPMPDQPPVFPETASGSEKPPPAADPSDGGRPETAILAGLPLAVFVLDREGRFTYLNPLAERFFEQVAGRGRDGLLGRPIWQACPEVADSPFAREYERAAAERRDFELEVCYPALDRWFIIRASLAEDCRAFFLQDVTDQVRLERLARQRGEEMAEAERGKDEFLVRLAHRVRNALVPLRNALHVLGRQGDAGGPAVGEREVRYLSGLVDDLLKVSHLTAGKLRPRIERFDLAKVIAQTLDAVLASGEGRGRSVTVNLPPEPLEVLADPQFLQEILTHLLNNAIQFTMPRGQIWLTAERVGDAVEVSVRDDGVGIAPELLPRVFNLFMRLDSAAGRTHREGLGLGLTVVRMLVALQGGTVEARSDGPGKGSEFLVRLPAAAPAASGPTPGVAGVIGPRRPRMKVLVVDNDRQAAQSVAMLVNLWGHEVRTSYDGDEALREALAWLPDVVLLDIAMPGMDGYEVAARLRNEVTLTGVVLVALTGYGQDEDRQRAEEVGFDHYLLKPVPPEMLQELLSATEAAFWEGLSSPSV
jgi:two-component system CheB/CheR fusion protein